MAAAAAADTATRVQFRRSQAAGDRLEASSTGNVQSVPAEINVALTFIADHFIEELMKGVRASGPGTFGAIDLQSFQSSSAAYPAPEYTSRIADGAAVCIAAESLQTWPPAFVDGILLTA